MRNRIVFKGFSLSPEDALSSAIVLARKWIRDYKTEKEPLGTGVRLEVICSSNTVVVRTDAAWDASRQAAGLGWILQSSPRHHTFKEHAVFVSSPLKAKALALQEVVFAC